MSFEQDRNESHHNHPIETVSVATYEEPRVPVILEIECTRCGEILFRLDAAETTSAEFETLLRHVGHGVEVIEEGAALACRADGDVLHVAEQG